MPPIEYATLDSTAVLWPFEGKYDANGQPKVQDPPVQIACTFYTKEKESTDKDGNTILLVGTMDVDRFVRPGSVVWEGRLADFNATKTTSLDGFENKLMKVESYSGDPDIKSREQAHSVTLSRYRGTLPQTEDLT